jgi:hypothetical protein
MTRAIQWSMAVIVGVAFGAVWLAAVIAGELSNFPSMTGLLVFSPAGRADLGTAPG